MLCVESQRVFALLCLTFIIAVNPIVTRSLFTSYHRMTLQVIVKSFNATQANTITVPQGRGLYRDLINVTET